MTEEKQKQLGKTLWAIADQLRGAMDADDFRDYMLSFLFLRYLSDNYEAAAKKELGADYPAQTDASVSTPLQLWYEANLNDVPAFEKLMRRKVQYVIQPQHLWNIRRRPSPCSDKGIGRGQNPGQFTGSSP
jgi:type I restriction enzyme M protein